MAQRLRITDAPGSGRTTLSAALAKTLGCRHFDTNDFYWLPADPPFRTKRHTNERLSLLNSALAGKGGRPVRLPRRLGRPADHRCHLPGDAEINRPKQTY